MKKCTCLMQVQSTMCVSFQSVNISKSWVYDCLYYNLTQTVAISVMSRCAKYKKVSVKYEKVSMDKTYKLKIIVKYFHMGQYMTDKSGTSVHTWAVYNLCDIQWCISQNSWISQV